MVGLVVVPQCNIPREPGGRAPTRGVCVHFPQTISSALASSSMAGKALPIATGVVMAAVASALLNRWLAKKAERRNPPIGRFITVDGVRLHYAERGTGTPLVLLHGNGSMIEDFQSSGLIDLAAKKYRVIAVDRPGFGHSDRPRSTIWTPEAQADLIAAALKKISVQRAIVLGHSWGTLVALALAVKYPQEVEALVLASGYYYPNARADVVILSPPAIPVIGDLLSHTLSPLLSRLMWPLLLRKIFGPSPVPEKFKGFPKEMALRPSQIRASAAESALMIPSADTLQKQYRLLKMPVAIIAGAEDRLIEREQSAHLHRDIPHSTMRCVPETGHMVHQTATGEIMTAIDMVPTQNRKPMVVTSAA
jgi:pimeloyl-ACP methyl ester carboxylesterase